MTRVLLPSAQVGIGLALAVYSLFTPGDQSVMSLCGGILLGGGVSNFVIIFH
jgi:hypothetical protein